MKTKHHPPLWSTIWIILPLLLIPSIVDSFNIPLPGGRRILIENGGLIRIQIDPLPQDLPSVPPNGSTASSLTLSSITVKDTETVKGFGAFCTKSLKKYTFLGFYEGTLIQSRENLEEEMDQKQSMDYVMSMDGGVTFLDGYDRAQDKSVFSPVHLNHEDKEKHGCNCLRILSKGQVAFFTSRMIHVGEELCFDYGSNYWHGREHEKI